MKLKDTLREDLKESMKSGEKLRRSTIRLLLSEVKNAEIEKGAELDDEEMLTVVTREAKRRREAIGEYRKGGRDDLVEKESLELQILEKYLPEQLTEDELRRIIGETIDKVGASSPSDIGKIMGVVMPRLKGRADGKQVNKIAREMLEAM